MGNCLTEWQTKVREERRAREDAELERMMSIPKKRADLHLVEQESLIKQLEEQRRAIQAIKADGSLSDDQKERALVKPVGAQLALESMLANAQAGYNRSLEAVALVVKLQQRLETNRDMADMKGIAASFPALDFEKLLDDADNNSEWVEQFREAVDNEEQPTDTLATQKPTTTTTGVLSAEVRKVLSAPSAAPSVSRAVRGKKVLDQVITQ